MINLRIVTPEGVFIKNKECEIVNVQTIDGDMGLLGDMAPFISALTIGQLTFREVGEDELVRVHVHRGILEVTGQLCKVISERVYLVDEYGTKIKTPQQLK